MWKWFKNLKSIEQKCEMWLSIRAPIILNVDWISRQVWWIAVAVSKYHTIIHGMYVFLFGWNITTYQYMSVSRLFCALNQTTPFPPFFFSPHDIWLKPVKLNSRQHFSILYFSSHFALAKNSNTTIYIRYECWSKNFPAMPSKMELIDTAKRNIYTHTYDFGPKFKWKVYKLFNKTYSNTHKNIAFPSYYPCYRVSYFGWNNGGNITPAATVMLNFYFLLFIWIQLLIAFYSMFRRDVTQIDCLHRESHRIFYSYRTPPFKNMVNSHGSY